MPEISRNGIYYRLEQSPYTVTVGAMTFYFSSKLYREKFYENIKTEIDIYNYRATVKSGITSTALFRPAFEYYRKVEKRGFYAKLECLGKTFTIMKPEDLRIADVPEVIFNARY